MAEREETSAPTLARRPYFAVPDRADEDVSRAFLQCFSSPSGQVVLDRLYWRTVMTLPSGERDIGRQALFLEILEMIQRGIALQRGGTHG